ncbi:hypothetical protein B0F90DRAFT_1726031 [Multifurca ochricompacta]|uniref:DUF455 family protein n=1 Tax=Multifurca ochricompacta TaxID=376703 RepID=A0AAD4M2W4_9AGAM|nr:hypothetical protein B0F90DRAFT_1726031 [Multifurca ochricompacta]
MLNITRADEVTHVMTGHQWFTWICAEVGVEPVQAFHERVRRVWHRELKGPFNVLERNCPPEFYLLSMRGHAMHVIPFRH